MKGGDIAFRCNFATVENEIVKDRRAGRIQDTDDLAKAINEHVKVPGVEIIAAEPRYGEVVYGLRNIDEGFVPELYDASVLSSRFSVGPRDAVRRTRQLLEEEGIFAGVSSGAIASIAVRIAGELDEGNVVFVICDDGWKYLSSGIYTLPVDEIENLESTLWW